MTVGHVGPTYGFGRTRVFVSWTEPLVTCRLTNNSAYVDNVLRLHN